MLRLHSITYGSQTDGPGTRTIVHTQGCTLACKGCFNTPTWSKSQGRWVQLNELVELVLSQPCDGITISGGEPLQQATAVVALLRELERVLPSNSRNVVMYTGYTLAEIHPDIYIQLMETVDLLVSGRYKQELSYDGTDEYPPLISSSNQQLIKLRGRIDPANLGGIPRVTVDIAADGKMVLQGFPDKKRLLR